MSSREIHHTSSRRGRATRASRAMIVARRSIAATLAVAAFACRSETKDTAIARRLVNMLSTDRFTAGRLAHNDVWERCSLPDTAGLIPHARCGAALQPGDQRFTAIQEETRELRRVAGPTRGAEVFHAQGLLGLRLEGAPNSVDTAVASLERARRANPKSAEILNDLAVAYLELGQREQDLDPMLRALDAVERALDRDSTLRPALFNRALIQQRLYLTASAASAWTRYLAVERDDRWRTEAKGLARRLIATGSAPSWAEIPLAPNGTPDSVRAEVTSVVQRSPSAARDHAFSLLRDWGVAVVKHDDALAGGTLGAVREIAHALDVAGADRSVALAVRSIDACGPDSTSLRTLAAALVDLGDGYVLHNKADFQNAGITLERAERDLRRLGSAAAGWASYYLGFNDIELANYASADARLRRLATETSTDEPALRGKAIAALGVSQLRRGNYEDAAREYRAARPWFRRAGEPESDAYISYVLTEALNSAGQMVAARDEAYRGLQLLSPLRESNTLNNHLTNVAVLARREGLGYAAVAIMREVLDVAPRVGKPQVRAWAYRAYARELLSIGRPAAARPALTEATRWADSVPAGRGGGDRVRADVQLVRAQLLRTENPRLAREILSGVVSSYEPMKNKGRIWAALYEMSMAAAAMGDSAAARANLDRAIEAIEQQTGTFSSTEMRASFSETVENVFDAMIELQLSSGHYDSAFAYLERGRVAAWSAGTQRTDESSTRAKWPTIEELRSALPPGMVVVEFALLRRQLVAWTISRDKWQPHVAEIPRDSIAGLVDQYIEESGTATVDSTSARARLFELLVRPVLGSFSVRRMSVVPDRELSRIPFAGLWDQRGGHFVLDSIEVRTLPSAALLVATLSRPRTPPSGEPALVVGNPALDPSTETRLPPLPGATREAQQVAALYPRSRLLTGSQARRGAVIDLLARSSVFHFAGHAIANAEQPELSYLALASTDETGEHGTLRGSEIGELRLSKVRLAVLSACSTLNPRSSHTGAIAGLAYSFLRAGVPATISTLWAVNDDVTAELLVEFHRLFAGGTPGAEALRLAQVKAMRSDRPELRTPRAWAAFIYTGP